MQDKNPPGKKIKWMNFWEDLLGATPNPFGGEAVVQNERSRDPKPLRGYGIQVGLPADKGAAVFQLSFAIRAQENSFFKFQIFYLFSIFSSCSRHFRFRCLPLKSPNFWCSTKNFFFFLSQMTWLLTMILSQVSSIWTSIDEVVIKMLVRKFCIFGFLNFEFRTHGYRIIKKIKNNFFHMKKIKFVAKFGRRQK